MTANYSIVLLAAVFVCAAMPLVAQAPTPFLARRIVYQVPGMDRVEARRDVEFRGNDGAALKMDVYAPPGPPARRPAVVFVHGGPVPRLMSPKDTGIYRSYGELVAASGFVGVTFNYRYYAAADVATGEADLRAAIDYVRGHAQELGIDPERLLIWVYSGGGPLISGLLREVPPYVRAIVAYYAILDLQQVPAPMAAGTTPDLLRRYSPVAYLREHPDRLPRLLVARAGRDQAWLNAALDRFVAEALAVNASIEVLTHPKGQHSFDIADDDDRSREIIARTIDFLRVK